MISRTPNVPSSCSTASVIEASLRRRLTTLTCAEGIQSTMEEKCTMHPQHTQNNNCDCPTANSSQPWDVYPIVPDSRTPIQDKEWHALSIGHRACTSWSLDGQWKLAKLNHKPCSMGDDWRFAVHSTNEVGVCLSGLFCFGQSIGQRVGLACRNF